MTNFQDKYKHLTEFETPVVKRGNADVLFRATPSEVVPIDSAGNNVFKFIITTNNEDRYGDIVEPSGMDATDYLNNPVFLFNHISHAEFMPIGKCLSLTPNDNGIVGETLIHGETELSKDALKMVQGGYLKAVSIGFMPTEWEGIPTEKQTWCEPRRYLKWNLLEYSLVNIPANPYALITNGFISDVRKCMEIGKLATDGAMVRHITNLLANGVSPELKKAIEREMSGGKINLFPLSINKKKFNLSIKRQILC